MSNTELPIVGVTMQSVTRGSDGRGDYIEFASVDGRKWEMYHGQDCCESVDIEDIDGELSDLEGTPISFAYESSMAYPGASESGTWTFYRIGTNKGTVVIRWLGQSNGYYSEGVYFGEVKS